MHVTLSHLQTLFELSFAILALTFFVGIVNKYVQELYDLRSV